MSIYRVVLTLSFGALLVFLFMDSPERMIVRLSGNELGDPVSSRQANTGLKLSIDLRARREGRRVAVLLDDWFYCYPENKQVFVVPRGYETDFASIPSVARWIVSPFGNHAEAAVIHDWLYAVGDPIESAQDESTRDQAAINEKRLRADEIFRFAMKEQGVNIVKRNAMYQAVRRGGKKAFGRANEWDDAFKDPESLDPLDPPFAKPNPVAQFALSSDRNENCEEHMSIHMLEWREELAVLRDDADK